jgi:hypothetical protein
MGNFSTISGKLFAFSRKLDYKPETRFLQETGFLRFLGLSGTSFHKVLDSLGLIEYDINRVRPRGSRMTAELNRTKFKVAVLLFLKAVIETVILYPHLFQIVRH